MNVGGREVKVSNLDKLWWPAEGITKGDVIRYYIEIAPWLLPHLRARPLVLTRYPDGPGGESFYQKNTPDYAPPWLRTLPLSAGSGRTIHYCLVDDVASLIWIVNSGAFEIHPFLSREGSLDNPDYVVFDLDPMEKATWGDICQIALVLRKALEVWGLMAYPKTSGSTGLQVYVPIKPIYTYDQARAFAFAVCQGVHAVLPEITTLERKIANRDGKLYLDYLQNGRGKTLATVYGVRPKPGATVSAPLTWDEVESGRCHPSDWTIHTLVERVRSQGDLFLAVLSQPQSLDQALSRLT